MASHQDEINCYCQAPVFLFLIWGHTQWLSVGVRPSILPFRGPIVEIFDMISSQINLEL